jgi:hypothetical protein
MRQAAITTNAASRLAKRNSLRTTRDGSDCLTWKLNRRASADEQIHDLHGILEVFHVNGYELCQQLLLLPLAKSQHMQILLMNGGQFCPKRGMEVLK